MASVAESTKTSGRSIVAPAVRASAPLEDRFEACMVLAGVGDALGYRNGNWEFNGVSVIYSDIESETPAKFGPLAYRLDRKHFRVSDDTVLHLSTAEGFCKVGAVSAAKHAASARKADGGDGAAPEDPEESLATDAEWIQSAMQEISRRYHKDFFSDMSGRAPGNTTRKGFVQCGGSGLGWAKAPFNPTGGGCGAAMRSMCIGLRFPRPDQEAEIVQFGIETGRMSHHHPTGYLGSVAGGLFTALALQGVPVLEWPGRLMRIVGGEAAAQGKDPRASLRGIRHSAVGEYLHSSGRFPRENVHECAPFIELWQQYMRIRGLIGEASSGGKAGGEGARKGKGPSGGASEASPSAPDAGADADADADADAPTAGAPSSPASGGDSTSPAVTFLRSTATTPAEVDEEYVRFCIRPARKGEDESKRRRKPWPGATGTQACILAYDALVHALLAREDGMAEASRRGEEGEGEEGVKEEHAGGGASKAGKAGKAADEGGLTPDQRGYRVLCERGALHSGDNDSTGTMAMGWWGAMLGYCGTPEGHVAKLEYVGRMKECARVLLGIAEMEGPGFG